MKSVDFNFLVVEDDDVDAEAIHRALGKRGASGAIIRAVDGVDALSILEGNSNRKAIDKPFVVLLDINMPRMDGHDFLSHIRQSKDFGDTIVFITSTSERPEDKRKAYVQKVAGYILKNKLESSLEDMFEFLATHSLTFGRQAT